MLINVVVPRGILQLPVALGLLVHILEEEVEGANSSSEADLDREHLLDLGQAVCFL